MRRPLLLASCVVLPVALGAVAQVEADRQLDAAVERLRAALGPGAAVEWRSRSVDPVSGEARLSGVTVRQGAKRLTAEQVTLARLGPDRVGQGTATGLRMEEPQPDSAGPVIVTLGRLAVTGLVMPAGASGAVNWAEAALEAGQAEGLQIQYPGRGEASLGRLSATGYAPGRLGEGVVEGFRFLDRKDGESRMSIGRARLAGAALPRIGAPVDPWALAADAALIEGAEIASQKHNTTLRLGRLQAEAWGRGRTTALATEGLRVETETNETGPFAADLGRLRFAGVPVADMAYAFAHNVNPPNPARDQEQNAEVEGLAVSAGGAPLMRIGTVRATGGWDPAAPGTQRSTLAVEGIGFQLPAEYGGDWLNGLGLKEVTARMGITALLTEEGRLTAEPFEIQAASMGRLGITMDVRGIEVPEPGKPAAPTDDPFALMAQWSLASLTLRYTDEGLLRAVVAQQARQAGVPEPQLREQYATMALRTPVPGAGPKEPPELRRMREAFAAFARDLNSIEIALRPAKPVPMLSLAEMAGLPPEQSIRDFGLSATAGGR